MIGLSACMRRDTPQSGGASQPAPTQAPAAQTKPAETKPAADAKPAAAAQPAAAPAKPAEAPKPAAGTPKRGGTITAAMQNDWLTFDTALNSASEGTHFNVYDPLFFFERDDKGAWEYTAGLVEKWELKDREAIFRLRKGVKFHDGSDWTAEVLAWNMDRWINDPKSVAKGLMGGIDWKNPATIVDQHTLKINLTGPTPTLLSQFNNPNTYPMSKAAFEKMGADAAGQNPVGTGPFKFVEWKKNDRVVITRNENYWMKDAPASRSPISTGSPIGSSSTTRCVCSN